MTTEKTDNTGKSETGVFGPLGKYAIIAILMVSIIVTTAIMLEKQLGTTEERLAAIQNELDKVTPASPTTRQTDSPASTAETATASLTASKKAPTSTENTDTATGEDRVESEELVATAAGDDASAEAGGEPVPDTTAETGNEKETASPTSSTRPAESRTGTTLANDTAGHDAHSRADSMAAADDAAAGAVVPPKPSSRTASPDAPGTSRQLAALKRQQEKMLAENRARIVALKKRQKESLAAMFKRIKALEDKQLNDYQNAQNRQITTLRQLLSVQQKQINMLIERNARALDSRKTSLDRIQHQRETILNRI